MDRRNALLAICFAAVIAVGAALGVASAQRGSEAPVARLSPGPSFAPGVEGPAAGASTVVGTGETPPPGAAELRPTATTGALPIERLPLVRFTSAATNVALPVEVPSPSEYGIGLSGRTTLQGRGMLFYYPDGRATTGFWMKDTLVDLEIAFVDSSMTVISVMQMKAGTSDVHRPDKPYMAAIEAPSGYFTRTGIGNGAKVEFLFDIAAIFRR